MCLKTKSVVLILASLLSGTPILKAQIATGTVTVNNTLIAGATYTTPPVTQGAGGTTMYTTTNNCELVSEIQSAANLGAVTARVVVNNNILSFNGEPFIGRYYDIHPSQNATQSAVITLYFSQADFDTYNTAVLALGNPNYPPVNLSAPNLLISVFHGLSTSGTTGPNGQYDNNNKELVTPSSVALNAAGFYEVTFTTPGFSGFFVNTTAGGTPLQLALGQLSATNEGSRNRIEWNTLSEAEVDVFYVERSTDGRVFGKIGSLAANGHAPSSYVFTDESPYAGVNYYRLQLSNANGSGYYSAIVAAAVKEGDFSMTAYPNPVTDRLQIMIKGAAADAVLELSDVTGHVIQRIQIQDGNPLLEMKDLAQGIYLLKFRDNSRSRTYKIYKNQGLCQTLIAFCSN